MEKIKITDPYDRKLTPQELADHLQVPLSWVYKHTRQHGKDAMPFLKCGKYCRFELAKVLEWCARRAAEEKN